MALRTSSIVCATVLALAAGTGPAGADGLPVLGVDAGRTGVTSADGAVRIVTLPAGNATLVARIATDGGRVLVVRRLRGNVTIPAVAYDGSATGLSADGRTLALIEPRAAFPRRVTPIRILDARRLRPRSELLLGGDFSVDAVSPDGGLVYLVQYTSRVDPTRYIVRALDARTGRLVPGPIVDPTEPDERMRGLPMTRTDDAEGRWAYTLYDGAGGEPFVHALDTAGRTARCIDLDMLAGTDVNGMRLRLDADGGTLVVARTTGSPVALIDLTTFEARKVMALRLW